MAKQSDIEFAYYYALKQYRYRHHLTKEYTELLFEKSHVYENMLSQHEYIHQIAIEEIIEYVDSIVCEDVSSLSLYHGTLADFREIDLSRSGNHRDFGVGFYTTVIRSQAEAWGKRLAQRNGMLNYYVYEYNYLENVSLKICRFKKPDRDWLEFIKENRMQGGCHHDYDIVIGPVADDNTMGTLQLYVSGMISLNAALEELRFSLVNNQISFHTEQALKCLTFTGRKQYERKV